MHKTLPVLLPLKDIGNQQGGNTNSVKQTALKKTNPAIVKKDLNTDINYKLQYLHTKQLLDESELHNKALLKEISVLRHSIAIHKKENVFEEEGAIKMFLETIEKLQMRVRQLEGDGSSCSVTPQLLRTPSCDTEIHKSRTESVSDDLATSTGDLPPDLANEEPLLKDENINDIDYFPETDLKDLSMIGSLLGDDPSHFLERPMKVFQSDSEEFTVDILDEDMTRGSTPINYNSSKIDTFTRSSTSLPNANSHAPTPAPKPTMLSGNSSSSLTPPSKLLSMNDRTPTWTSPSNSASLWKTIPTPKQPISPTKQQLILERDALEEELIQRYTQLRMMEERLKTQLKSDETTQQ
jgi:hypothetical protein